MTETNIDAEVTEPTVETPVTKSEEKRFTQSELDRVIKDRVAREQANFKKSIESYTQEKEELNNLVKSYEHTLEKLLTPQMEQVPAEFRSLLDKLPTLEKLEWLASNIPTKAEKRKIPSSPAGEQPETGAKVKQIKKFL